MSEELFSDEPVRFIDLPRKDYKDPVWGVQDIWARGCRGVIGGREKAYKSHAVLDLAVSLASGKPFLDQFPVREALPVLYVNGENSPSWIRDRVMKMASHKGVAVPYTVSQNGKPPLMHLHQDDIPLAIINYPGWDLSQDKSLSRLEAKIQSTGAVCVILDPWYALCTVNQNDNTAVGNVLNALSQTQQDLNCGPLVVHHYRKTQADNPAFGGAGLSGGGVFYRWLEDGLYLEKPDDHAPLQTLISNEHRYYGPLPQMRAQWSFSAIGDWGPDDYGVDLEFLSEGSETPMQRLTDILEVEVKDGTPVPLTPLAEALGLTPKVAIRMVEKLPVYGMVKMKKRGAPVGVFRRSGNDL